MEKTFTQKTAFRSTKFIIEDTGLLIQEKSKQNQTELHYPFEQIKTNRATVLDHNKSVLTLAVIFAGIALLVFIMSFSDKTVEAIAAPLWLSVSALLFLVYFKTKRKKLFLQTENKPIQFLADKSNFEIANNFIEQLLAERNLYLVSKYAKLNRNLAFGPQLDNLNWLLNNRAISKVQYDEKVQELNFLFNGHLGNKPIGFSTNN
jgi:hypothetical protein